MQQVAEQIEGPIKRYLGPKPEKRNFMLAWHFIKVRMERDPKMAYDAALEWGRLFAEWSMRA